MKEGRPDMHFDAGETLRVLSEMRQLMLTDPAKLAALSQEAVVFTAGETGRSAEEVAGLVAALNFDTASDEDRRVFLAYFSRMASAF